MKKLILLAGVSLFAASCGTKTKADATPDISSAAGIQANTSLQGSVVEEHGNDAVQASSAGEQSSGGAVAFALTADETKKGFKKLDGTCVVEGATAKVTISSEINRERPERDGPRGAKVKDTRTGKSEMVRIWSKADGTPVLCAADGKHAQIDWKNMAASGLKVSVSETRSGADTRKRTLAGVSIENSDSFSMTSNRSVEWTAVVVASDSITRTKKVTSNSKRERTFVDKSQFKDLKGPELEAAVKAAKPQTVSFEVKTVDPLIIKVVRGPSGSNELVSQEIVSGSKESSLQDGGKVLTTFKGLKWTFADGGCDEPSAGAFDSVVSDKDGKQLRKVSCSVSADGDFSCLNDASEVVEVAPPSCRAEDNK